MYTYMIYRERKYAKMYCVHVGWDEVGVEGCSKQKNEKKN